MPSPLGAGSIAPSGYPPFSKSTMACASIGLREPHALRLLARELRETLLIDLPLKLDDAVDERLGPRRTPGDEDVHGNDLVDALDDRVVVEDAADRRAGAHRNDIFRLRHLVVDAPQHRRHLAREAA